MGDIVTVESNKQAAVEFLQMVIAGRIDDAYAKHVDMRGRHHNAYFAAGFSALKQGMLENHVQFPHKRMAVQHVLGDGDLVAVHSHIVPDPSQAGVAAVHLFRFNAGRIVELWDCGQPVPADSPNTDGTF